MRLVRLVPVFMFVGILAAGCSGDLTQQVMKDPKVVGQVMDAISTHREMAMGMVDRLSSSDSLRAAVADQMLQNDAMSKHLLDRVAGNPQAIDYVLQTAIQDPRMREHIVSLVKGVEMASAGAKQ